MTIKRSFVKLFQSYLIMRDKAFSPKYLLYTNVLLSVAISTTGDILAQNYELHQQTMNKYDIERSLQMGVSGSVSGAVCHHWYNYLDKIIVGRTFDMVLKKLILDQCFFSPIIILSFFATVAIFEDNPIQNFNKEVSDKFWTLYKAEWIVWPPAQIINFYFLPTRYRVAYDNTISLGYDIYTSQVKHSSHYQQIHSKDDKNT